jgi:hypothetical protein
MNETIAILGPLIYIPGAGIFFGWMMSKMERDRQTAPPAQMMVVVAMALLLPLTLLIFAGMVIFCREHRNV